MGIERFTAIRPVAAAIVLITTALPAWGYQIHTVELQTAFSEGDGVQTVGVEVLRDQLDPPTQCDLQVQVTAQGFSNPISDEATPGQDFTVTSATLDFSLTANDSSATQTFDVPVLDDNLVEGPEFFTAVITNVTPGTCDPGSSFQIDSTENFFGILDDDAGALSLSVDQPSIVVNEDGSSVTIGVTLSGEETIAGPFEVSVSWQLADGTATALADYGDSNTSGVLVFDETTLTQSITVPLLDDAEVEAAFEDFTFTLANPEGIFFGSEMFLSVALPAPTATVQIADDDSPGTVTFAGEPFQVQETAQNATITLRRTGGDAGTFTAFYTTADGTATEGADYQQASGSVTWADGDTADKTFTVPVIDDADGEGDETVLVRIGPDPQLAEFLQSTLTIVDDEGVSTAGFVEGSSDATEDGGEVVLTLVRGGSTEGAVSVDYATEDGTAVAGEDYVAAAGTVTWADGDGEAKTIVIQLLEDDEREEAESFTVNLANVTGSASLGSNSSLTVTIGSSDTARDIAVIGTLTPNQRVLAQFFDQTCDRLGDLPESPEQQDLSGLCGLLRDVNTSDADVQEVLDEINPEELLVSTFNALRLTAVQHGNLSQRLNALRGGATGLSLVGLNLEIDGQQIGGRVLQEMFNRLIGGNASADEPVWGRWGGFINGRIANGDQDESDNEAGFDFDLYSITAGVDYRIRPNLIVGLSAGTGTVDTDYQHDGGGLDIDSWTTSAYLTYFREKTFYLDAVATYGRNDYDSRRNIAIATDLLTVNREARGKTDGTQFSFGFGSGWDFSRGGLTFGPHGGAYYFDVDVDGFSEIGAGGLNLTVGDQSSKSVSVNAGGHVSYAWLTGWGVLVPNAKVDWVHEFEDNRETLSFSFANDPFAGDPNDPSPTLTLQSNRPDTDYFIWSAGVSAQFIYGFSGFVNYQSYAGYGDVKLGEWSVGARWEKTF